MKAVVLYAAATVALVALLGWLFGLHYVAPAERRALWTSGVIAVVLQVAAFVIARAVGKRNVIAGWGIGAALCIAAVILFGFAARGLGLPIEAALLSLATFLFVTELVEPLLLRA
ncbi:MAG: hypothetical protein ACJ79S_15330 [Gemmatimonadaceae bacterium]